jgi:hypothetical protein
MGKGGQRRMAAAARRISTGEDSASLQMSRRWLRALSLMAASWSLKEEEREEEAASGDGPSAFGGEGAGSGGRESAFVEGLGREDGESARDGGESASGGRPRGVGGAAQSSSARGDMERLLESALEQRAALYRGACARVCARAGGTTPREVSKRGASKWRRSRGLRCGKENLGNRAWMRARGMAARARVALLDGGVFGAGGANGVERTSGMGSIDLLAQSRGSKVREDRCHAAVDGVAECLVGRFFARDVDVPEPVQPAS